MCEVVEGVCEVVVEGVRGGGGVCEVVEGVCEVVEGTNLPDVKPLLEVTEVVTRVS